MNRAIERDADLEAGRVGAGTSSPVVDTAKVLYASAPSSAEGTIEDLNGTALTPPRTTTSDRAAHLLGSPLKATVVAGAALLAYHNSLGSLMKAHSDSSTLVSFSLVPALAILVAAVEMVTARSDLDMHDRSLDYIIGTALLGTAVIILCVLPVTLSVFFWTWRLDLLSVPFFVAGAVGIAFGIRMLWRHRIALLLLFMIWPFPYVVLMNIVGGDLAGLVDRVVVHQVLSTAAPGARLTFLSANGLLALLATTTGIALIVRGRLVAKGLWVMSAVVLAWVLDLSEAVLSQILVPERLARELSSSWSLGMSGLPLVLALLGAFAAMGPLRLRLEITRGLYRLETRQAVRWAPFGLMLVLSVGLLASSLNTTLPRYASLADNWGHSRIPAGAITGFNLPGWAATHSEQHRWAAVYLDRTATWTRYTFHRTSSDGAAGSAGASLTVDVISTTDLSLLSTYGIQESYRLQQRPRLTDEAVDLGSGVVGRLVSYALGEGQTSWTGIHWQWPVVGLGGHRYERIVMSARETLSDSVSAPASDIGGAVATEVALVNHLLGARTDVGSPDAARLRNFMIWAARYFVETAVAQATGTRLSE